MTFIVEKPKTKKGLSYVLKSSMLKSAIIARGIECYVHLVFWTPRGDNKNDCSIVEAEYWLPNRRVEYPRFYIRSGVVPSIERKEVEIIFVREMLPELVNWMENQVKTPIEAINRPGMFYAIYKEGKVIMK